MILGASISEKLRVLSAASGTPAISWKVDWISANASSPPVIQGTGSTYNGGQIASSTTTDLKVGDASNKTRILRVTLKNESSSVTCDVTPIQTDGTNPVSETKATLLPLETLVYNGSVWIHQDANGAPYSQSVKLDAKLRLNADQTFATAATFADITGLTVPLISGRKYSFEAHLYHINNATTTGSQFGVNIGAAPTFLQIATIDTVTASVTASVHSGGAASARDTAATAQTTGSVAISMGILSGTIVPSADGTFAIRATSEVTVASGLIVKAGSWLRIWECDN